MRSIAAAVIGLVFPLISYGADIDAGREKAQACTACHGANGVSISDDIPNLAGQKAAYIVGQLKAFREQTRKNPLMNAMAAQLSDADIDNLAAFFNGLATPGESSVSATGEALRENKISFPDDYRDMFTLYSKSSQAGPKRVRHNFANSAALQDPDDQGMLADGAFILTEIYAAKLDDSGEPIKGDDDHYVADKLIAYAVMEKRQGYGDAIPEVLRNSDWNYAVYSPEKTLNSGANQAACLACHKPLDGEDYLFSYKELVGHGR